jgi:gas vesicle protein
MRDSGRLVTSFFVGLGIGAGLALLFAPQSGRDTREWIGERSEDEMRRLRKKGRRSVQNLQDFIEKGEDRLSRAEKTLTRAVTTGKEVLENLAAKLE